MEGGSRHSNCDGASIVSDISLLQRNIICVTGRHLKRFFAVKEKIVFENVLDDVFLVLLSRPITYWVIHRAM